MVTRMKCAVSVRVRSKVWRPELNFLEMNVRWFGGSAAIVFICNVLLPGCLLGVRVPCVEPIGSLEPTNLWDSTRTV